MDMRTFFDTWFQRFWVNEDMSAAEDMAAAGAVVRGLSDAPQITRDELRGFGEALLGLCKFDDIRILHFTQTGDWAHMLVQFKGTCRATSKPVLFDAQVLARAVENQIVEAYNHPDFFTLFQQLGSMPKDAISRCLAGKPMV